MIKILKNKSTCLVFSVQPLLSVKYLISLAIWYMAILLSNMYQVIVSCMYFTKHGCNVWLSDLIDKLHVPTLTKWKLTVYVHHICTDYRKIDWMAPRNFTIFNIQMEFFYKLKASKFIYVYVFSPLIICNPFVCL